MSVDKNKCPRSRESKIIWQKLLRLDSSPPQFLNGLNSTVWLGLMDQKIIIMVRIINSIWNKFFIYQTYHKYHKFVQYWYKVECILSHLRSLIHMKFSNDVLSSLYGVAAQCEHLCGIVLEHQNLSRTCRQRAFS